MDTRWNEERRSRVALGRERLEGDGALSLVVGERTMAGAMAEALFLVAPAGGVVSSASGLKMAKPGFLTDIGVLAGAASARGALAFSCAAMAPRTAALIRPFRSLRSAIDMGEMKRSEGDQ